MRLVGWKAASASGPPVAVVYKGPFAQVADEDGTVYRRGEPVSVNRRQAEWLRRGPAADQFTLLGGSGAGCGLPKSDGTDRAGALSGPG
jgi:hypothetical protein